MGDNSEPLQLLQLQINLVSARDLAPISKGMQTYAVLYVNPEQKMTSRVDSSGHTCPEWNEKFTFSVLPPILYSDCCTVVIEIYAKAWIRDTLVGSVQVPAHQIVPANPTSQTCRAVALQIRRVSGRPQGILNIAVSLLEDSPMGMPLSGLGAPDEKHQVSVKQLADPGSTIRRMKSGRSSTVGPDDDQNGAMPGQCGSMCSSDVGPSASVVAAAVARGLYVPPPPSKARRRNNKGVKDDGESSILLWADEESEEAMKAKIERWKKEMGLTNGGDGEGARINHRRRRSSEPAQEGKAKVFRCFGNAYGFEFTIVCGGNNQGNPGRKNRALSDRSSYVDL